MSIFLDFIAHAKLGLKGSMLLVDSAAVSFIEIYYLSSILHEILPSMCIAVHPYIC